MAKGHLPFLETKWQILNSLYGQQFETMTFTKIPGHRQSGKSSSATSKSVSFFFGGGGSSLSPLLMQTTSLLFEKWAASLSRGDRGSDRLGSGVLGALSEASTSDR